MNHQAKLIVFDWDGTLMDSAAHIVASLQTAIAELGLEPKSDDQIKNIIGLGLREAFVALYPQATNEVLSRLTAQYRDNFFDQQHDRCELFTGARELLEDLHAKDYYLAIATGKGRNGLDLVLKQTGLNNFFPITRCADESHSKPHPQMLLEIIDYYGIAANETIMVGDTEYDLQMANNAETLSVAVTYGVHHKQRLLDCKPLTCLDNVKELHQWLLN
jgi:phosphoglycolate phosphatase